MKLAEVEKKVGFSLDFVAGVLQISPYKNLTRDDLSRIASYLEAHYSFSATKAEQLRNLDLSEPPPKVNFGAFLLRRQDNKLLIRLRKTRNCGDTAGLVLDGLKEVANVTIHREIEFETFVSMLRNAPEEHEVWDVTIHQHTFTIERSPSSLQSLLIQAYQAPDATYNVQAWSDLDIKYGDKFCEKEELRSLAQAWRCPDQRQVKRMAKLIAQLYAAKRGERGEIWKELPFNPYDKFDEPESHAPAFLANRFTFNEEAEMGASLRGLLYSLDELK